MKYFLKQKFRQAETGLGGKFQEIIKVKDWSLNTVMQCLTWLILKFLCGLRFSLDIE